MKGATAAAAVLAALARTAAIIIEIDFVRQMLSFFAATATATQLSGLPTAAKPYGTLVVDEANRRLSVCLPSICFSAQHTKTPYTTYDTLHTGLLHCLPPLPALIMLFSL